MVGYPLRGAIMAVVVLSLTGCAGRLPGWGRQEPWPKTPTTADPLASVPPVVEPAPGQAAASPGPRTATRAGSNLSNPSVAAAEPAAAERAQLVQALTELQNLGAISPAEQAQLIEDLKSTDPQLWPLLIQYARAARQASVNPQAAAAAALPAATSAVAGYAPSAVSAAAGSSVPGAGPPPAGLPGGAVAMAAPPGGAVPGSAASAATVPATAPAATPTPAPTGAIQLASATLPVTTPSSAAPSAVGGPSPASEAASATAAGTEWQAQLAEAIRLHEAAQAAPGAAPSEADLARLRMLYLAAGRRDDAMKLLDQLPAPQQAFWSNTLFALSSYLDEQSTPDLARRAALALTHLETAEAQLASLGSLSVRNLSFCTEVKSFGIIEPFERYEFAPGQEVLLYAELENFHSEETPEGFHTAFRSSYEIFDSQGRSVDKHEFALTEETCRNRRRDFFIRYYLQMPREQLYDGKHTLRLTIEDTLARKVGQASLDFVVKRPGG